jgi:anti-sigma regulatory factor (Ser/Thr protein kinase)/biotin operon repressor
VSKIRGRGEAVRNFILANVKDHPGDIAKIAAEKFECSRQAIHKHIQRLVEEGAIMVSGTTRSKRYGLASLLECDITYEIVPGLAEDIVWDREVAPKLGAMADNVKSIWYHGFTEIFNNAIDHSSGTHITVHIAKTAAETEIAIHDNGIGIFKKIQGALGLLDERHAVLELAKGKLTTDPSRHSGEGIFFSSRMFDNFAILSGEVYFSHHFGKKEDWIFQSRRDGGGTFVTMKLNNHTSRTTKKVFDRFSSGDDYGFTKTVVPVELAQYGDSNLVSRSQAKRVLARIEKFKVVVFDFEGVKTIGQAFADEVFRVFTLAHPHIETEYLNANKDVSKMILRALHHEM